MKTLIKAQDTAVTQLVTLAPTMKDPDALRVFLVLLMNPLHSSPGRSRVLGTLCLAIMKLPTSSQALLQQWIRTDVPVCIPGVCV